MTQDDERRAHPRASVAVQAWVARDGARVHAETKDISIGGVSLAAQAEWTTGDEVEVVLDLPGDKGSLTLTATVAWRREEWVGVQFASISAEDEARIQHTVNEALGLSLEPAPATEELADEGTEDGEDPEQLRRVQDELESLLEEMTGEISLEAD